MCSGLHGVQKKARPHLHPPALLLLSSSPVLLFLHLLPHLLLLDLSGPDAGLDLDLQIRVDLLLQKKSENEAYCCDLRILCAK